MSDQLNYVAPNLEIIDVDGSELTPDFIFAYVAIFFTAAIALNVGVYANVMYTNNIASSTSNNTVYV